MTVTPASLATADGRHLHVLKGGKPQLDGSHGSAVVNAALLDLQAQIDALAAKVNGSTVTSPPSLPAQVVAQPIVVTSNGVTIENLAITISGTSGAPIIAQNVTDLTIRNCHLVGGNIGASLENVQRLVIEDTVIEDADYAGILGMSVQTARCSRVTVRRVGMHSTSTNTANAYGIAISRYDPATNKPADSADWLVEDCVIEDVPLMHGINTHSGQNLTFNRNVVRRCPRPFFITSFDQQHPARNVNLTDNKALEPTTIPGGQSLAAVTLVYLAGGTITGTKADKGFGSPLVYPYLPSTWTDGGGNVLV